MLEVIFYALQTAIAITLPLIIKSHFEKGTRAQKGSFGAGLLVYLLWGAVINSVIQVLITTGADITSSLIMNPWVSALFSGCVYTICLTAGRVIWIKYILKKAGTKTDALVFGTGVAYAMSLVTYALSGAVSTVFAVMDEVESTKAVSSIFETTAQIVARGSVYTVFLITLQLVFLCIFEICISAILFTSLKKLSNKGFTVLAFLASAVAYTFLETPLTVEVRLIILAAITLIMAGLCWRCTKKE